VAFLEQREQHLLRLSQILIPHESVQQAHTQKAETRTRRQS